MSHLQGLPVGALLSKWRTSQGLRLACSQLRVEPVELVLAFTQDMEGLVGSLAPQAPTFPAPTLFSAGPIWPRLTHPMPLSLRVLISIRATVIILKAALLRYN